MLRIRINWGEHESELIRVNSVSLIAEDVSVKSPDIRTESLDVEYETPEIARRVFEEICSMIEVNDCLDAGISVEVCNEWLESRHPNLTLSTVYHMPDNG